jgi:flagella basal body P-ring formation protein FlgA
MVRHFLLLALLLPAPDLVRAETATRAFVPADLAVALATKALRAAGIFDADPIAPSRPMPGCEGSIAVTPRQGNWSTVALSCDSPRWTRSMRTRASATMTSRAKPNLPQPPAEAPRQALSLTHSLGKGEVITPDHLILIPVSEQTSEQVYTDPETLIGRRLKQAIAPGKPILPRHLETNWMVEKGAPVVILTQVGGISVSSKGEALENAAFGDLVAVRAYSSGRSVSARVIGTDTVSVGLKLLQTLP